MESEENALEDYTGDGALQMDRLKEPSHHTPGDNEDDMGPKLSVFEYRRDHYLSVAQREHVAHFEEAPQIHSHLESKNLDFGDDEAVQDGQDDSDDSLLKKKEDPS